MKNFILLSFCVLLINACVSKEDVTGIVTPSPTQIAWADAEIGLFLHLDMNMYEPETFRYEDASTLPSLSLFNPTHLNTDQWLEAAVALGAKYAVLTAKHGTGFTLWPTKYHDYHVGKTPWREGKGDIVADFVASCKKYGVKPGVYYNTGANTLYGSNYQRMEDSAQAVYNKLVINQLTELWTEYGKWFEIWFDGGVMSSEKGGVSEEVKRLVRESQPDAVLFQGPMGFENLVRWVGNEYGVAPYPCWATCDAVTQENGSVVIRGLHGSPDAAYWCPGESDFPIRNKQFMWQKGRDKPFFSLEELMTKYETSVGRNTNMLLGAVIDDTGIIPAADMKLIKEFGNTIRERYGSPLKHTKGKGKTLTIRLPKPVAVSRAILQEDISKGERTLKYKLFGKAEGEWVQLSEGSCIGHKHIEVFEKPIAVSEVKLQIDSAKATPHISNFAIY
jgi:alpha-L-fucosidase